MLTRNSKLWLRATVLISCLFMLSASFYAWGSTDKIPITTSGTIIYGAPISNATLRFKSGFESPVYLTHSGDGQTSWLHGADQGYDWDDIYSFFNYVKVGAYPNYVDTQISTVRAHSGTRSLYQKITYPSVDLMRNQLDIVCNDGEGGPANALKNMQKVYLSNWMFFPSYVDNTVIDWNVLTSIREASSPESFDALYIYRNATSLYWYAYGGAYTSPTWTIWWRGANNVVPVPINQWFKLEMYIERSLTDGVFQVWVDGVEVFNFRNVRTSLGASYYTLRATKLYGGNLADLEMWSDDLEIWDGMPLSR